MRQTYDKKTAEYIAKKYISQWATFQENCIFLSDECFGDDPTDGRLQWTPADEPEDANYRLLWRAVRLDERRVTDSIEEFGRIAPRTIAEVATREERLGKLRIELAQIHRRKDFLCAYADVDEVHSAENRYVIEEMTVSRLGATPLNPDDLARREAEIRDANEQIDEVMAAEGQGPAPAVAKGAHSRLDAGATGSHGVPKFGMARAALIRAYEHEWPTIRRDLQDASRNGLAVAKAGARNWTEIFVLDWARSRGKLKSAEKPADALAQGMSNMASLPGQRHALKG